MSQCVELSSHHTVVVPLCIYKQLCIVTRSAAVATTSACRACAAQTVNILAQPGPSLAAVYHLSFKLEEIALFHLSEGDELVFVDEGLFVDLALEVTAFILASVAALIWMGRCRHKFSARF